MDLGIKRMALFLRMFWTNSISQRFKYHCQLRLYYCLANKQHPIARNFAFINRKPKLSSLLNNYRQSKAYRTNFTLDNRLDQIEHNDLHANNLFGSIPEWIIGIATLAKIDLHRNRLEGSIPSLENCYTLGFLDLSENLLSRSILSVFPLRLKSLQLPHNRFSQNYSCSMGPAFCFQCSLDQLAYLTTLYGDNNNFSGVLDLSQLNSTGRQISLVNNSISSVILPPFNTTSLLLGGNPVCNNNDQIPVRYCRTDGNTIIIVEKGMILNP